MSFSFPTPHHEKITMITPLRAATVGAAAVGVALESVATMRSNRRLDDRVGMVSTQRDGDQAVYVLPGCRTDGRFLARALDEQFTSLGSTHFVAYPQKGFSVDSVRDAILEARAEDDGRPASFYVLSMGGIVLSKLLADQEFRDTVGTIEAAVFDSSPIGAHTLTAHTRRAMHAAARLPRSWSLAHMYTYAMQHRAHHIESDSSQSDILREHLATTAKTPLQAVSGQTQLIRDARFKTAELHVPGQTINRMAYIAASMDDVVDVDYAHAEYERVYDRNIEYVVDTMRPSPSHAAGPEHWQKVVELLADKQTEDVYEYPLVA